MLCNADGEAPADARRPPAELDEARYLELNEILTGVLNELPAASQGASLGGSLLRRVGQSLVADFGGGGGGGGRAPRGSATVDGTELVHSALSEALRARTSDGCDASATLAYEEWLALEIKPSWVRWDSYIVAGGGVYRADPRATNLMDNEYVTRSEVRPMLGPRATPAA